MNLTKNRRRRAVSETIGTLLILAVTFVGAVLVANFVREGFFSADSTSISTHVRTDSIQLSGYDARDNAELMDVETLNNWFDSVLCTSGAAACTISNPDNIPSSTGTEFIALKIRNMNPDSVYLHSIQINNILHPWESSTANYEFDATASGIPGDDYPTAGTFSILPLAGKPDSQDQKATNELRGDEEVRVVVKLSNSIPQDIALGDSILIHVNFGAPNPAQFVIVTGDAKW